MSSPDRNLYHLFHGAVLAGPERPCLVMPGDSSWSYRTLDQRCACFAAALLEAGVRPGDRVLVQVDKSADAVALYLACLYTGAVHVPLNPAYTGAELDYFLNDAEPAVAVVRPGDAGNLTGLVQRSGATLFTLGSNNNGSLADLAAASEPLPQGPVARANDDLAAIVYTSGTTGRSKGAMLSHGNLASNARSLRRLWGWQDDDVLLHMLPLFHVHGLFVALHCALFGGTAILLEPRFDATRALALLPHATVFMGVPTFYSRLLAEPALDQPLCRQMRLFISGSAPLTETVFQAFAERTGHTILERYGMSETGMLTSNPLVGERLAGTVGAALPEVDLRICAADGSPAPVGTIGAVEVRGPNVFQGYWRMPEKTREELRADGWFSTGDLGFVDVDGRLTLVGRSKDLVISGGYNIYPKEVERLLDALPGVRESAVVGVPHPDLGEAVVAAVVPIGADASLDPDAVLAALADRLARFKQPRAVFMLDELPRNAMGKLQKTLLRELFGKHFTPDPPP